MCIRDRYLIRRWAPDLVVVSSTGFQRKLEGIGLRTLCIPIGVDLEQFHPPQEGRKEDLKRRFGFPEDQPAVLHVGHIKENRNLSDLAALTKSGRFHVVVLGSTSTEREEGVRKTLEAAGVKVITEYVADVENLYRAADVLSLIHI